jgi:hypothetical protein
LFDTGTKFSPLVCGGAAAAAALSAEAERLRTVRPPVVVGAYGAVELGAGAAAALDVDAEGAVAAVAEGLRADSAPRRWRRWRRWRREFAAEFTGDTSPKRRFWWRFVTPVLNETPLKELRARPPVSPVEGAKPPSASRGGLCADIEPGT